MLEKNKRKLQKARRGLRMAAVSAGTALAMAVPVFATEVDTGFKINFDVTQMFTVAQPLIDGMMPVVYITAGLGLAFMIINALKNAFR